VNGYGSGAAGTSGAHVASSTAIRCICGEAAERGEMVQCQVGGRGGCVTRCDLSPDAHTPQCPELCTIVTRSGSVFAANHCLQFTACLFLFYTTAGVWHVAAW
jgi:hypothetical protein